MPDDSYRAGVRRLIETGDHMSEMDRSIAGHSAMQLRFRIRDQMDLRRAAAILRDFANRLEIASDPRRFDERDALGHARHHRKLTQDKLASLSRPRKDAQRQ